MSKQTTSYTTAGTYTYTAPSTLIGGTVVVDCWGSPGASSGNVSGGNGGRVRATVTVAPGGTLNVYVGDASTHGYHTGGTGSAHTVSGQPGGQHGGGSSAILASGVVMVEAAGGGGGGGDAPGALGGVGGAGGSVAKSGGSGSLFASGSNLFGGGAGGGGGTQGNGTNGPGVINNRTGGPAPGGAGGEFQDLSTVFPGYNSGGGGGAGGTSYVSPTGVSNPIFNDGVSATAGAVAVVAIVADAPLAPTLENPPTGTSTDANALGVTFSWIYHAGTNSGTQNNYALRLSQDGAAYGYWNGTNFSSSTPVWNSSTSSSVAIPASVIADGHTYTWSVATEENSNNLQGPFAPDQSFVAAVGPIATYQLPTGSTFNPTPQVVWLSSTPAGSQTAFRVVVYTQATTLLTGFSPGVTAALVDSGVVASSTTSWQIPTTLLPNSYVIYVQITETGSVVSPWASGSLTIFASLPAVPVLTATPTTDPTTSAPIVNLTATFPDNYLSTADAQDPNIPADDTVGTWTAGSNTAALTISTAHGGFILQNVTSGTVSASTSHTAYSVTAGNTYTGMAYFLAGANNRSCTVGIAWYTSGGSLISTSTGTPVTDSSISAPQVSVVATAPATAAFAQLVTTVTGLTGTVEDHIVMQAGLFMTSTVGAWSRGGLVGGETATFYYSDDSGTTWTALRGASSLTVLANTQQLNVTDWESPFGASREYKAVVSAPVTSPYTTTITNSATVTSTLSNSTWWLSDPTDNTTNLSLSRLGTSGSLSQQFSTTAASTNLQVPISAEFDSSETMGVFYGWGNADPIIQRGTVLAKQFTIAAYVVGYANYKTWQILTGRAPDSSGNTRQRTLLLRSDMGDAWYVVIGPGLADQVLRAPDRVSNPQWVITLPVIVTTKP